MNNNQINQDNLAVFAYGTDDLISRHAVMKAIDEFTKSWNGEIVDPVEIRSLVRGIEKADLSPVSDGNSEAVAWRYKTLINKHSTGAPLEGEILVGGYWGSVGGWILSNKPELDAGRAPVVCVEPLYTSPQPDLTASLQAENKRLLEALKEFQHAETCRQIGDFQSMHLALSEAFEGINTLITDIERKGENNEQR
jgi:hypothetical protein